jgi:cathepsin D
MTLPGYDETLMKDRKFNYHNVIEKKYYSLNLTSLKQGSTSFSSEGYKAVIDSGTSVMIGPHDLVNKLLDGVIVKQDCSNVQDLPEIAFVIDDKEYRMKGEDYVLKVQ